jgi:hypothetical protein
MGKLSPLILAVILGAPAWAAEPEFSLAVSVAKDGVKAGAEVRLRILLTNLTDHQILIGRLLHPLGQENEYSFDVRDDQGRKVPLTRYGRAVNGTPDKGDERQDCGDCSGFGQDVEPHEKITDEIVISKIYDLTKPGKYTVQASRSHRISRESETIVKILTAFWCAALSGAPIPTTAQDNPSTSNRQDVKSRSFT